MARQSNICVWDFTIPKSAVSNIDELKDKLNIHCKKWIFQEEKGTSTGYEHYQGRISLKMKARKGPVLGYNEH